MDSGGVVLKEDTDALINELEQAGFSQMEIGYALEWLEGLVHMQESIQASLTCSAHSIRYYLPEECHHLNVECRGFLLYLEQLGILDVITREIVIDRLMALEDTNLDLGRTKWVVLIALFNQPNKKAALSLLQNMILSDVVGVLH